MEHAHPSYAHIGLQKSHIPWVKFEENPISKNQGWEPIHQKYKANENTSRHNPKKERKKANNQQNQVKTIRKEDS
jgi:hypothetical protein